MNYGEIMLALKQGFRVARTGWNGKGIFVYKQIPIKVKLETVQRMTSLPQLVKTWFMKNNISPDYKNNMLIVNSTGEINSWVASSSDTFAEDWIILD